MIVAFPVKWALECIGLQESFFSIVPIYIALFALVNSYKSFFSTKVNYYDKLFQSLSENKMVSSLKKWKEASEIYFTGDDFGCGIIAEAFDHANIQQEIDKTQRIRIINAYLSRVIKAHQRDDFYDYEPVFEFVYRVHGYLKNNMLHDEHVRDLFQREELTTLLEYGIYFLRLCGNSKKAEYYEPAFTKVAKLVKCSIWQTCEHVE